MPEFPLHTAAFTLPARVLRLLISLAVLFAAVASGIPVKLPVAAASTTSPTGDTPGAWPAMFADYRFDNGNPVMDTEGEVSPGRHDIGSDNLTQGSTALASDGTNVFFQLRMSNSPIDLTKGGWASGTLIVQVATEDSPGVWSTKAVAGLNGKKRGSAAAPDYVYVAQAPGTGVVPIYEFRTVYDPGGAVGSGARVMCDDGTAPVSGDCPVGVQYLLDLQVPLAHLSSASGGQITESTPVRLFYGSSAAANLATINKDFMTGSAVSFDNLTTVSLQPANLNLTQISAHVSGSNPPSVGVASVYDITLSTNNDGAGDLSAASISMDVPAGVSIVSTSSATGSIGASGQTVTWSVGDMSYGGPTFTATIRVSATPSLADEGNNIVLAEAAAGTGYDPAIGVDRTDTGTQITAGPVSAPTVTSTTTAVDCGSGPFTYGSPVLCTITVTDGPGAITPTGDVALSASSGSLDAAACTLAEASTGVAECTVAFTPTAVGSGSLDGDYAGDLTHDPSSGSSGTLTIDPADLTVTGDDAARAYGAANPSLTATITGFVAGDDAADLGGSLECSTTATTVSPAGDYPITCSGLTSSNYAFDYVDGTLDIDPATLTVTADDAARAYGAANPSLTATLSGFVAGDDAGDLGGTLACSTTATTASPTGDYPITCSGLTSSNYDITFAPGTLTVTITPATPTLSWAEPDAIRAGTPLGDEQLNAAAVFDGALVDGTFTYDPATGTELPAGQHTLHVTFTPDSDNYVALTGEVTIDVVPEQISLIGLKSEPVGEGEELTLTAHVEGCYLNCEFTWYVGGEYVGDSNSTLDTPVSITVVGADATDFFTAFSDMTRVYTPGQHLVRVDIVDAVGFTWAIEGTVTVLADPTDPSPDPDPTPPTPSTLLPDTAMPLASPNESPKLLLALLISLTVGSLIYLARRLRHPA